MIFDGKHCALMDVDADLMESNEVITQMCPNIFLITAHL